MSEEKLSVRTELERLEAIVRSLEGENLDLDQALEKRGLPGRQHR